MRIAKLAMLICGSVLFTEDSLAQFTPPKNWESMEVEAKWGATRNAFERIINDFKDGAEFFGYALNVRWSGIPRKFVDYYYDDSNESISRQLHSLRHRKRYTSKPLSPDRLFSSLVNSTWRKDWERVQYKSTPVRIGAVWFRKEVGDCRIWDRKNEKLCNGLPNATGSQIVTDAAIKHEAMSFMALDHPDIDRSLLKSFLIVTDFRYRVVFGKGGNDIFEVSLDHVFSQDLRTELVNKDFEVELEIISPNPDLAVLRELFRVAGLIQQRYDLTPSTKSKGGNQVPEYRSE